MKKFLSFLTAILFAGSMMATLPENPQWEAKALADIADGSTLIIISNSTTATNVALPSTATTSNPAKKICEVTTAGGVTTITAPEGSSLQDLAWTLVKSGDNYKFYQEGSEEIRMYLTGLSTNTGLRIGNANSANDEFVMGDLGQLLKVTTGTRFVGPYDNNGSDWRTYNTENATNYKGAALTFYVLKASQGGEGGEIISTTKTVYCKAAQAWWTAGGAAVGVYAFLNDDVKNADWPGVRMTAVEGETDLWKADIDTAMYAKIIFTRMNPSDEGDQDWGAKTADLTVPADKNLYTITSTAAVWGDPGVTGEWSVYAGEEPTPVEAAYYLVGTMNNWQADEAYKFGTDESCAEGEFVLHTTLAENDEIKVIKVEGETTTWYPAVGDNYIVDALHAGEKDIYFRPAGNEAWADFGGYIWMGENQPAPVADFTQPFTLRFNGTGESGKDASAAFTADVAAIFDAASAPYVASVETATKVYAGRPIADDNSSVKFGTTSAQGTLAFTLAQAIEVDSIIVNATQYGNNAAKVTVNGTEFDLTAGNKKPQDCKITPENAVSAITIAQSGSERIYLRNVRVYPKNQGGDTPVEIVLPVVKLAGSLTSWSEPALMVNAEDSLSASVTLNLGIDNYQLKVVSDDNWLSKAGDGDLYTMHRDWNHVDHLDLINTGDNIKLITDVEGAYTFTWTYADSTLVVTFPEAPAKPNYYLIGDSAFVVDAGATADKAWTPDAIPSFQDTTVLNLKAGVDYIMRLSLEGTWENHRDFRHLTDTAAGLIELPDEYQNRSIGFRLNEAGPVTIIYIPAAEEQPEVFKLIGDFYVAPAPDPTVAVMGSMNDWAEEIPFVLSDDKTYASLTVENIGADEYEFKFIINGEWRSNGYRFHREFTGAAGITENNKANMVFVADQDGEYTFYWYFANDSAAIVYPEYIEPAKEYYAKYAPAWEWVKLTEAEGLWLTDTLVYQGIGININDKADDENNMFYSNTVEEEGVRPIAGAEIDVNDTIYFSFNPADSVLTAVMVGKYVAPDPTVAVMGSMNEWAEEIPFVLSDDKTYASLTVENIGADEYEFKFIINGEWRSNGYRFHREFTGAAGITENNEADMVFVADQDGEYTFYWYFANDSVAIVYPEYIEPAKEYYAKYAPAWEWVKLTEAEGLWLTDTLVYQGIGININDKADDENNMFYSNTVEEEGVRPIAGAEIDVNDTIYFSFNPADSTLAATLVGKYVAPVAHYFIAGTMNEWNIGANELVAGNGDTLSLAIALEADSVYEFKVVKVLGNDTAWFGMQEAATMVYGNCTGWWLGKSEGDANQANVGLQTTEAGEYLFIFEANEHNMISVVIPEPAPYIPTLTNGYYLVGKFSGVDAWSVEDLSAEKLFGANTETEGEYQLSINLAINDEVKVVYVENDAIVTWYPAEGDNYTVDHNHAGPTTMYFRPEYNSEWSAFGGYFYIVPTSTVGFENTAADAKAVKVLKNGILVIEKNNKTYNVMGQMVK